MSIYTGTFATAPAGTAMVLDPATNTVSTSNKPSWNLYKILHTVDSAGSSVTYNNTVNPAVNCTVNSGAGTVTITVPGKYYISWKGFSKNVDTILEIQIRKNSTNLVRGLTNKPASDYYNVSISCILDLVVNDVIDVYVVSGTVDSHETASFSGFLI